MNQKTKALTSAKAPTPFQMIGRGVKSAGKSVGKALYKTLVEPSVKVNKIRNEKMEEMDKKAKSGEFNY